MFFTTRPGKARQWLASLVALLFMHTIAAQPVLAAEVVQIAAPSAAGISRNVYPQFDVGPAGLILNNSSTAVQTQLAGTIAGNANLAGGPARIILNEVTGAAASQLRGFIEVAGQRAEVVIANPNGIVVDGAGFINAGRVVLTTGTPVFGGSGSLSSFRVTGGQIAVQGAGLDAGAVDRVDLISRAMTLNATVKANELNVIAGANTVSYDSLSTRRIRGAGPDPEVAIDVGALGGMYAGKIKMVATDRGVGVNSQGVISAAGGDIVLTSSGKIVLANQTSATGAIAVSAASIDLSGGMVNADGDLTLKAKSGDITNNSGFVNAGGAVAIITSGALVNGMGGISAGGSFAVTAVSVNNSGGFLSAGGNLTIAPYETASFTKSYGWKYYGWGYGGGYGYKSGCGGYNPPAAPADQYFVDNSNFGFMSAGADLIIDGGQKGRYFVNNGSFGFMSAGRDLSLTVGLAAPGSHEAAADGRFAVDNSNFGFMSADNNIVITVNGQAAKDYRGGAATATVNAVTNAGGSMIARNDLVITAQDAQSGGGASTYCTTPGTPPASKTSYFVSNVGGELSAGNNALLTVQGAAATVKYYGYNKKKYGKYDCDPTPAAAPFTIDNTNGLISAAGDLVITTKGSVNNSGGELTAGDSATVTANSLVNQQGVVNGDGSVTIITKLPFDTQAGQVTSNGPIVIPNI